jgi:hypothetical protein
MVREIPYLKVEKYGVSDTIFKLVKESPYLKAEKYCEGDTISKS